MKNLIFATLTVFFLACAHVYGQNPVPDPDTVPNPVQEGDPSLRTLPPRLDFVEDRRRVMPEELPEAVKQTLEGSAQYTNWQKATIYHDENKDEYIVEFTEKGTTTTYRFNNEGRPVVVEDQ